MTRAGEKSRRLFKDTYGHRIEFSKDTAWVSIKNEISTEYPDF